MEITNGVVNKSKIKIQEILKLPKHVKDIDVATYIPAFVFMSPIHHIRSNFEEIERIKKKLCISSIVERGFGGKLDDWVSYLSSKTVQSYQLLNREVEGILNIVKIDSCLIIEMFKLYHKSCQVLFQFSLQKHKIFLWLV